MARSTLRIDLDLSDFYRALDVLEGPGPETMAALNAALAEGFAQTQARVHVITGSLKGSGRVSSRRNDDEWSGEISYGGRAPGFVNDPVDYARYEFGRGGSHDAMSNLPLLYSDFENAMFASVEARL